MHQSRLGGLIIDCHVDDLGKAAEFWSKALGHPIKHRTDPSDENYIGLEASPNDLDIEVQKADHSSRVHIDIESDDIEAEVRRLEHLGAKRIKQIRHWRVLEAPTGQRFCVVPPQRSEFAKEANTWEE